MNLSRLDFCKTRKFSKPRGFLEKSINFYRCFNQSAKTSVQITFLTDLTGILLFLTYNHHIPCKKRCVIFWKKSPNFKTILAGSKYAWMKLRLPLSSRRDVRLLQRQRVNWWRAWLKARSIRSVGWSERGLAVSGHSSVVGEAEQSRTVRR